MFVIKEALRGIRRMPGSWIMGVLTLTTMLGLGGFFGTLAYSAHATLKELRAGLAIEAFFSPSAAPEEIDNASKEIGRMSEVAGVTVTSKEAALEEYRKASGEDLEAVLGVNPLPASLTIHLVDPTAPRVERVVQKVKQTSGIAEVRTDIDLLRTMETRARSFDLLSILFGSMLVLTAGFYVITYTGYHLSARREAIATMSLLGATRNQIILPATIEALMAATVSGALAATFILLIHKSASAFLPSGVILLNTTTQYVYLYAGLIAIALILVAIFSTLTARLKLRSITRAA